MQGVGGRVALAILSVLDPADLAAAVSRGDKAMVARANGVGPKLAMRIVNELAGKLGNPALAATAGIPTPRGGPADALSALANLGFKPADASAAVAAAVEDLARGHAGRAGAVGASQGGEMSIFPLILPLRPAQGLTVTGEPVRVSVCRCRNCQKRSWKRVRGPGTLALGAVQRSTAGRTHSC